MDQKNVKVQLSVRSIDKTKKVVNLDDIKNIDKAKQGFYITINFLYSNGKSIAKSAELKYSTLPEVAATDFKEMNVSYTSPVKVGVGSSIKSVMDPKKSDLKVVLNKKGLATNAKVDMGKIYSTEAEAVKNTGRGILTSPVGKFSKFTKNNATYYQNVTVSVNDDKVKSLIKRVLLNEEGFSVTASDKIASIAENEMHFVRKISVVDATTPDTTDPEEPETTDSAWKESSVSGIVTTGNKDYYTLVNGENKPVANRALGGNTSWITDTVRENSKGDKQYRVATNEWIDAKDITFSEGKQSTAINEITDLPRIHVVTVDTPGFVYPLFTIDGVASTRSVAGGTAWATDKVGKDSAGNTYYRVSTTEWILAGNGVHFE
ncbi:hypothetical protein [Companilactobacillus metriopterae]|uniref:hypothetical protein n=1 Tax=Companilactobacillus metriopterae TaxID=1909267 RepID=UPI00100BDF50|nr:hypothetical protein [Companilactobacillus metriopterae]